MRDRFEGLTRIFAYVFVVKLDGWRLFCVQHNYDPDFLLKGLPGYGTVCLAEEEIRETAFTPEEADEWARRDSEDVQRLIRPDDEAAAIKVRVSSRCHQGRPKYGRVILERTWPPVRCQRRPAVTLSARRALADAAGHGEGLRLSGAEVGEGGET
jgi:hypothetical protein